MPLIAYERKNLAADTLEVIAQANRILAEYEAQGFDLTLRQLFYQYVSRALIENTERSYKRLGGIINDARLTGRIDWNSIIDRTRNLRALSHWENPAEIIAATSKNYRVDLWADQPEYVEVWIEKDALVGVIQGICQELDVPYFSCRGYTSQSEMWRAGQRLLSRVEEGKRVTVLHLGDHDPSGIDMSRDIEDRLVNFVCQDYTRNRFEEGNDEDPSRKQVKEWFDSCKENLHIERIALTMDQVKQYNPPPNPAKLSDSRARDYILNYGDESWELDALEPTVLAGLVREHVEERMDEELWDAAREREDEGEKLLRKTSRQWGEVVKMLSDGDELDDE